MMSGSSKPRWGGWEIVLLIASLLLWQTVATRNSTIAFLYSSPIAVAGAFWRDLLSGVLPRNVSVTLTEIVVGMTLGTVLGTGVGLLLWAWPRGSGSGATLVSAIGAVPVIALGPMMIMWFGTGILAKVIMAGIAAFCVSVTQAFAGAREASTRYGRLLSALQVSRRKSVKYFLAPAASTWVVQGARINISLSIVGAFSGEFISSEVGLGHYVLKAGGLYDTSRVLAGVLTFVLIALFLDRAVAAGSRVLFPWSVPT